jgi:hypothetical protein
VSLSLFLKKSMLQTSSPLVGPSGRTRPCRFGQVSSPERRPTGMLRRPGQQRRLEPDSGRRLAGGADRGATRGPRGQHYVEARAPGTGGDRALRLAGPDTQGGPARRPGPCLRGALPDLSGPHHGQSRAYGSDGGACAGLYTSGTRTSSSSGARSTPTPKRATL